MTVFSLDQNIVIDHAIDERVLNAFGLKAELADKHIENRVHDVSHAIYASYAAVFVTDDRKLLDSSMAVYERCGFGVEILNREQFLASAAA